MARQGVLLQPQTKPAQRKLGGFFFVRAISFG